MDLFQTATRQAFRFASIKGQLSVEELWQLPLQSKTGFDLDSVAKNVNANLKEVTEESFVAVNRNPQKDVLTQKLDVLKAIIAIKQEEGAAARALLDKQQRKAKLLDALGRREDAELEGKSREELLKEIEALG